MNGVLDDILVVDFSTLLPGPLATLLLAEAGAEVVKVERPPSGDDMRGYGAHWGDAGASFALLNRGKKSVVIDLKNPAATAALRPLLARADVVVEQFRPGVMDRLGLGYAAVRALNPDVVYCSITGYGQTGPKRLSAGHDLNYVGATGLLSLGHGGVAHPVVPPALVADIAGGSYPAVVNILLALRRRDRIGEGAHLDIAMTDALFPFLFWALGEGQATGRWPGDGDALLTGGACRYRLYRTADDRLVAAAALEDKFWHAFAEAIGLDPELRDDARDPAATLARVGELIGAHPAAHWRRVLEAADCCCSVVATLQEALADPQFRGRGLFDGVIVNAAGAEMMALPVPIAASLAPSPANRAAPRLGEHQAVLDDGTA